MAAAILHDDIGSVACRMDRIRSRRLDYMSCAPDRLYGQGGFYEQPELLSQLSQAAGQQGEMVVAEVFPSYGYVRGEPKFVSAADAEFRQQLLSRYALLDASYARGAPSLAVKLENCWLNGSALYLPDLAGARIVYETNRANDRPYVPVSAFADLVRHAIAIPNDGCLHFFVGSAGSSNYGHWLVDDLPRIRALAVLREQGHLEQFHIWLTSFGYAIDRVRIASLRCLCESVGDFKIDLLQQGQTYHFGQLHYTTPVSYHPVLKSPEAVTFLAKHFESAADDLPSPLRLFVTRRKAHARALLNEDKVRQCLESKGFISIDVEQMDFVSQASTFAAANVIVGCMGAAMTNSLFARPACQVIHLSPQGWTEPFYWDLASIRKHHYSVFYGEAGNSEVPVHMAPFSIDLDRLEPFITATLI